MEITFSRLLCLLLLPFASCLILPMTNSNGSPDTRSIINHVTLMEQTIASLQADAKVTNTDLTTVKVKLQSTEDELAAAKSELSSAKTNIAVLEEKLQKSPDPVEFANMKSELAGMKLSYEAWMKQINFTILDFVSTDVQTNIGEIQSLKSEVQSVKADLNNTAKEVKFVKSQMLSTSHDFIVTSNEVKALKSDMISTKSDVNKTDREMSTIKSQMLYAQSNISNNAVELRMMKSEFSSAQLVINSTAQELKTRNVELANFARQVFDMRTNLTHTVQDVLTAHSQVNNISQELVKIKDRVDFKDVRFRYGWNTLNDYFKQNVGGGYDYDGERFTAPVSGTYMFWITAQFQNLHDYKSIRIYKGDQLLGTGFGLMNDEASSATAFAVEHLDVGDTVFFSTSNNSSAYRLNYGRFIGYGGALLHPA